MGKTSGLVGALRWVGAVLFALLTAVSVPALLVTNWMKNEILDTEAFVATLEPLAYSPQFQDFIADSAATAVTDALSDSTAFTTLEGIAGGAAGLLDQLPLGSNATDTLDQMVADLTDSVAGIVADATMQFLQSDSFPPLWSAGMAEVHGQLIGTLAGTREAPLGPEGGALLTIQVAPLTEVLKQTLTEEGQWWAQYIPQLNLEIPIAELYNLPVLQKLYSLSSGASGVLLALAIVCALLAVLLAPGRLLMAGITALLTFGTTFLLAGAVPGFGTQHLAVLSDADAQSVSTQVWSMLSGPLTGSLHTASGIAIGVAVLMLAIALITYFFGGRGRTA
ncbi:hypothetical protein [Actinomyces minihominis]|uniref:hypothetical protein n=1 Tax=Actinomyces minihominis TaxID=2002838 RepID=UPI00101AD948|nr:hypothetical protein [Actinomyces minihominis]